MIHSIKLPLDMIEIINVIIEHMISVMLVPKSLLSPNNAIIRKITEQYIDTLPLQTTTLD